jgi:hypothetical protein
MLSNKGKIRSVNRYIKIDLRNILANPLAFTLPMVVILVMNLFLLNTTIKDIDPQRHLVEIETYLLLNVLFASLLSIPLEIRERYAERIQYEFLTYSRRIGIRLGTNCLMGLVVAVLPYLLLTIQSFSPKLALTFEIRDFLLLILAVILISTLATFIGALFKSYLLLSIFGSLIFLLQISSSIQDHNPWAFSTFVMRLVGKDEDFDTSIAYLRTLLLEIQLWILVTSPFGMKFNRGGGRVGLRSSKKIVKSYWGSRFSFIPKRYLIALAQEGSIRAHMAMIPFSLVVFLIYPLINSADAFSALGVNQRIPILGALLTITVLSCVISMGAYKLSRDEEEREALAFGSLFRYRRTADRSIILGITFVALSLGAIYLLLLAATGDFPKISIAVRTLAVILLFSPVFASLGRKVIHLRIDVRFYILFALIVPLGEMVIASIVPQASGYLPSSILAHLAGGKGLYELIVATS